MDLTRRYDGLEFWSPVSPAGLEAIVEVLPSSDTRALDLGCGTGRLLALLLDTGRVARGIGLDHDARALARARVTAARSDGRLSLLQADARALPLEAQAFDLICCLGGPTLAATPQSSLGRLASLVPDGGWLLHGDVVWQKPPSPEYLAELGDLPAESICSALARTRLLDEGGLDLHAARDSTKDEWDAFEDRLLHNLQALAEAHPGDEALATRLAAMRRWNAAQGRWGRGSMAFSLQLWHRPR